MKTKLVRPVLVESKERTDIWAYKGRTLRYNEANFNDPDETKYYQLILISLEDEKIEVGDIATQFQLSPKYIQQFIEEYNKGEVKNVEIEMDWQLGDKEDDSQNLIPILKPKLTNGYVTIVNKEVPTYTEKEAKIHITKH